MMSPEIAAYMMGVQYIQMPDADPQKVEAIKVLMAKCKEADAAHTKIYKSDETDREIERLETLIEQLVEERERIRSEADEALQSAFEEAFAAFKAQMQAIAPEGEAP
jgi:flagellar biosynthesis/type III secretory pathway protein FliH